MIHVQSEVVSAIEKIDTHYVVLTLLGWGGDDLAPQMP